ncbi:MAG: molecular chaperone HscC [Burkholderiaceae bacterium]|jgi:molecular chaperone HscC
MIIGIDLGTTNSLVAVWQDGQARLIENSLGEVLTPSCVSLDADGSVLVGRAARERLQTHPDRTAAVFKRYMGSDRKIRLGSRTFRPEELSALILKALKADAEATLGVPVTEAIITVPAYFSDAQRKATRAAGQMAGLRVERLLNEPTAAALAYGIHQRDEESKFLVFDLGGGTFDVSILQMYDGVMEVRSSAGDNFLGGQDVVDALVELFFRRVGLPDGLRQDIGFIQRLGAQAEAAKRALGTQPRATMRVHDGRTEHQLELDEQALEDACKPLLQRLRAPVERALRDANLRSSELDTVVLAGGATRMPVVRRLATTMFGRFPAIDLNPDEVVALGVAVQCGLKARDAALSEVVMTDVAPYSLGIELSMRLDETTWSHGHFDPIIERNTVVPVSRVKTYYPAGPRADHVALQVYQGEARMVKDNIALGSLKVPLPQGSEQERAVDVRFTYDINGLLQVEAKVAKTGQTYGVVIEGNPGVLSEEQIQQHLKALAELKIHPRDQLENRTLLARAERCYEQLRGDQRDWLGRQIMAFEQLLATQDARRIGPGQRTLRDILDQLDKSTYLDGGPGA